MRKAPAGLLAQVPAEHGCSAAEVILSAGMFMASGRHLEVGRTFWEISGFAGSIVALIGNITSYPGSLAALAGQHEHASNSFFFGGDQYRGKFQVPDEMMAIEVG
jgi:hypothetical protein